MCRTQLSSVRSLLHSLLGAWLFASLVGGCATPKQTENWVLVETPNFEIASNVNSDETIELAHELERFRALVFQITTAPKVEPPIPTHIFLFDKGYQFARYRSSSSTAGYFSPRPRANFVALADVSGSIGATEIMFHEYVHFLLRNGTNVTYPMWYDEGFAEVLSTVQTHKGQLIVGAMPKSRIDWFKYGDYLSMERVIETSSPRDLSAQDLGMFYAQAWALAHYVTLDLEGGSSASISKYMSRLERGDEPKEAYQSAFGESIGRTGLRIRKKLKKGDWKLLGIPLDRIKYEKTPPSVRPIGEAEMARRLGGLQIARGEGEAAEPLFETALALDPTDSRAHAGMGDALKFQEKTEEARAYFVKAVELGPEDPLNHLDFAEYLHDLAIEAPAGESRRKLMFEAREAYRRSLELDPTIPETPLMFGRTFLEPGEDISKAIPLIEAAYRRLPAMDEIFSSLAEAYVANGRENDARKILQRATSTKKRGSLWANLEEAIEEIRTRRQEAQKKFEESAAE